MRCHSNKFLPHGAGDGILTWIEQVEKNQWLFLKFSTGDSDFQIGINDMDESPKGMMLNC